MPSAEQMDSQIIASAQSNSIAPLVWSVAYHIDHAALVLSVFDISREDSPIIVLSVLPKINVEAVNINDNDPGELARRLLDRLLGSLRQYAPEMDTRNSLLCQITDWIVFVRTDAATTDRDQQQC